jgi:hypothetical protein
VVRGRVMETIQTGSCCHAAAAAAAAKAADMPTVGVLLAPMQASVQQRAREGGRMVEKGSDAEICLA